MNRQRAVYLMLFPDKCWHEIVRLRKISCQEGAHSYCNNAVCRCGYGERGGQSLKSQTEIQAHLNNNPDLTTWTGFGIMWDRAQEMEWWKRFMVQLVYVDNGTLEEIDWDCDIPVEYINPARFLDALYDFGTSTGRIA